MSEERQGRRRRTVSNWTVQPLEGRVMPSGSGVPSTGVQPAVVASPNTVQPTDITLRPPSSRTPTVRPST